MLNSNEDSGHLYPVLEVVGMLKIFFSKSKIPSVESWDNTLYYVNEVLSTSSFV